MIKIYESEGNIMQKEILEKMFIIESQKEEIKNLKEKVSNLEELCNTLNDEIDYQKKISNRYIEWYEAISNSTVWKLSKPLRILKDKKYSKN